MYSRNYYTDEAQLKIPENYDGTALIDERCKDNSPPTIDSIEGERENECSVSTAESDAEAASLRLNMSDRYSEKAGGFDILSLLSDRGLKNLSLKSLIPNFGTEELLLLALAAFLLFSKTGDKECAILILVLIFIK